MRSGSDAEKLIVRFPVAEDRNLHTTVHGSGKPLLLVHGIGSTAAGWQPIIALMPPDRRVMAVDLRGAA